MNTNAVIAIIVVLVVTVGGYFAFTHKAAAPVVTTNITPITTTVHTTPEAASSTQTSTQPAPTESVVVITYTDKGFTPKSATAKVGETVRFVNNSSQGMWVASNNHPTHTLYDGTSVSQHCSGTTNTKGDFDACKPYDPSSIYSFTFTKAGTFTYHNHVSASDTGSITVTQ